MSTFRNVFAAVALFLCLGFAVAPNMAIADQRELFHALNEMLLRDPSQQMMQEILDQIRETEEAIAREQQERQQCFKNATGGLTCVPLR